ncbi:MAG: transporter substrate-binding domain-containing protein [Ardenticatenaceae bacterium]|nr:transporter substrate-binding domain-containing protein [Ardenticatenaceae bacterium]HBY92905.1 hypothetical protein [Chloroflexota bacterium]
MSHYKKRLALLLLLLIGFVLVSCGQPATPQTVEKVVTQVVEKVVTQVVEKEVTQVVEKEVTTIVEVQVEPTAGPFLERARTDGLRVGFVQEKPFGYVDDQGNCTGIDIEVTREAAKRLGINEIICVHLAWEGLIPGLLASRIDVIPVGMAIRPERCEVVQFTDPYQAQGIAALVLKENPKNIHGFQDFVDNPNLKLGASIGASELTIAREQFHIPEDRAIGYSEQVQVIDDIVAGRIDAGMYTAPFVNRYIQEQGPDSALERATPFDSPSYFNTGHGFRKDDPEFVQLWNNTLLEMKRDGTIAKIAGEFGYTDADLLGEDAKVENCCSGDNWQNRACLPK